MEVKDCVRCKTAEVDRRFCFEVNLVTPNGMYIIGTEYEKKTYFLLFLVGNI